MTAPLRPSTSGVAALRPTTSGALPGGTAGLSPTYNVIVFVIDDAGKEYFSAYDNATWTGTPIGAEYVNAWAAGSFVYPPMSEVEELASEGLLLTRMNVAAMCSPTRASLLTGRHNRQHTMGNALAPTDEEDEEFVGTTIYKLMEEQGSDYERIHIGKWHVQQVTGAAVTQADAERIMGNPVNTGRATLYQGHAGNWNNLPGFGNTSNHEVYTWCRHDARANPRPLGPEADSYYEGGGNLTFDIFDGSGTHSLVRTVSAARRAIQDAAADAKPFLMNVWWHAIHEGVDWSGASSMGGAALSDAGYHSYGTSAPGGGPAVSLASNSKAFLQSVDTGIRLIRDAMTPTQRANTMIVVLSDNGTTSSILAPDSLEDILETSGQDTVPAAPDNPYSQAHSKRSPWQGGIGAACIIHGPGITNPGDGSAPRVWNGLAGVEDLFALICHWTGTRHAGDARYDTTVLRDAVADTSSVGRTVYLQRAFQIGYHEDPYSLDQGGQVRFISAQNAANWKLLWVRAGGAPSGEVTWEWQLYDMGESTSGYHLEATDLWAASKTALGGTPTMQAIYNNLTSGQKTQFAHLYGAILAENLIPPGMAVTL